MSRISVLEIISGFAVEGPLGGIERFGIELAQAIDPNKFEVMVCGMWAYGTPYEQQWVDHLEAQGIRAFFTADWDGDRPYDSFRQSVKHLPKFVEHADIIHSHCQFGDGLALLHERRLGAKALVRTVHNEREWGKRPLRRLLLTNLLYPLKFDAELGVAQQVVDNLDKRPLAKWRNQKAIKSYNALNIARFNEMTVNRNAKRASLNIPPDAYVIGSIGRLSEQKAYADLIDAFKLVRQTLPNSYLVLIGEGQLKSELLYQAETIGVSDHIRFLGSRTDVEALLMTMDLFVNSSHWEGLPTVVMESMAAGVPVVATNVGGNRELILQEKTGWIVPAKQPAQLANSIVKVLRATDAERERVVAEAKRFVLERFTIGQIARQHEALYSALLTGL